MPRLEPRRPVQCPVHGLRRRVRVDPSVGRPLQPTTRRREAIPKRLLRRVVLVGGELTSPRAHARRRHERLAALQPGLPGRQESARARQSYAPVCHSGQGQTLLCRICGKSFRHDFSYTTHTRTHSRTRPGVGRRRWWC